MVTCTVPRVSLIDRVQLPRRERAPLAAVLRRMSFAAALIVFVALVVRVGQGGYVDIAGDEVGLLDALYYASVTVTTTGYGDITAVSEGSRLATILLITPARILFLILVVGTTVEVLTNQSRQIILTRRWRQRVKDHVVICGFGATGRSAAVELGSRGVERSSIVVVDIDADVVAEAARDGFVSIQGDASQNAVLEQAAIGRARAVVVTPNRDDTAVLVTLTARELNPRAHIVSSGREQENLHLLRQGGANEVIDATAAVGRMLGLATQAPGAVHVLDDLIRAGTGLELVEVSPETVDGRAVVPTRVTLVAVVREGERLQPNQLDVTDIRFTDRLVVLRESEAH
jgi:voltage-gated potassium channel